MSIRQHFSDFFSLAFINFFSCIHLPTLDDDTDISSRDQQSQFRSRESTPCTRSPFRSGDTMHEHQPSFRSRRTIHYQQLPFRSVESVPPHIRSPFRNRETLHYQQPAFRSWESVPPHIRLPFRSRQTLHYRHYQKPAFRSGESVPHIQSSVATSVSTDELQPPCLGTISTVDMPISCDVRVNVQQTNVDPKDDLHLSESCPICLDSLISAKCYLLPRCGHLIHISCMDLWSERKSKCPICNTPVSTNFGGVCIPKDIRKYIEYGVQKRKRIVRARYLAKGLW